MTRTALLVLICVATLPVIACCEPVAAPERPVSVTIDGRPAPFADVALRNANVMVYCGDFEKAGWAKCEERKDGSVVLIRPGMTLAFTPGSRQAELNKLIFTMPEPATAIGNRLFVAIEFVCRSIGYAYEFKDGAVKITTTSGPPTSGKHGEGRGRISGRVTYAGAPLPKVRVRLVDREDRGKFLQEYSAIADPQGRFQFDAVPAGVYSVYARVGDNPQYFNRMSEKVPLSDGTNARIRDLRMGRILAPVNPERGGRVIPVNGKVTLTCTACPSAKRYDFTILAAGEKSPAAQATSTGPSVSVAADLQRGRKYIWQVRALDAKGEFLGGSAGCGSAPWVFWFGPK